MYHVLHYYYTLQFTITVHSEYSIMFASQWVAVTSAIPICYLSIL